MRRDIAYCPYCKAERQLVYPKLNIPLYIAVSLLTFGVGLFLYPILHYGFSNKTNCHVCGGKIAGWLNRKPLFKEK